VRHEDYRESTNQGEMLVVHALSQRTQIHVRLTGTVLVRVRTLIGYRAGVVNPRRLSCMGYDHGGRLVAWWSVHVASG